MTDYYYCAYCSGIVGDSDEAVSCDLCSKWQHRICDTGITKREYNRAMRGKTELVFTCYACKESEMEDSGVDQQPEQMEGVAHSTMIDASTELPPPPCITFNLEFSTGSTNTTSTDTTAADTTDNNTENTVNEPDNTNDNTENEPDNARARAQHRPKEPDSLDFEVNTDFLKDDFLVGDVRVEEQRHLLFATSNQLEHLQKAKRWYLDGTFNVVNKPFAQLFSIHAFMRKDDAMKQVPLLFVLMSKRRKQDYVAVFQKVLEILTEAPVVEGFVMDFEAGKFIKKMP